SPHVAQVFPIMQEALSHVGHRQTRNRGTFGGSLCHLDPSAELLNMTALHDGTLTATAKRGERKIASTEWVQGIITNALGAGDVLPDIELRPWAAGHAFASEGSPRRHGDFAIAAIGCL